MTEVVQGLDILPEVVQNLIHPVINRTARKYTTSLQIVSMVQHATGCLLYSGAQSSFCDTEE